MRDDSEEKDILAVKIKHHGQCPFEKGHSDDDFNNGYMIGLCTIPLAAALALFLYGAFK